MLYIHRHRERDPVLWTGGELRLAEAEWIDLFDPTPAEREAVQALIQMPLPDRDKISRLGLSSRHHNDQQKLSLHAYLYADHTHGQSEPLGILVTKSQLVTLRYQSSRPFDQAVHCLKQSTERVDGPGLLVLLLDAVANDVAEQMQHIAADVAALSDDVFVGTYEKTRTLHKKLVSIGQLEGRLARYRTPLLGIGRLVGYVQHRAPEWIDGETMACVKVLANDLKVLDEFDEQLTGKLQFLQDAVLGFINTDQNAVMKLLTVASVVTIPPIILAGIWGMNFKHMPELDKVWGYPMALGALFVSMLLPLVWFGLRGWISRD